MNYIILNLLYKTISFKKFKIASKRTKKKQGVTLLTLS
jgi:hypothetical protein